MTRKNFRFPFATLSVALSFALVALSSAAAFTLDRVQVPSESMKRSVPTVIIKPDGDASKPMPVLYLLHGWGGNEEDWNRNTPIAQLADQYHVLVVCPDGENSWYLDSPVMTGSKFETFVAKELVKYVDGKYSTIPSREGRGLCGFSMGGHGALYLAIRHLDTFGAAMPIAGGVDFRPFPENWNLKDLLGTLKDQPQRWDEHVVINQIKGLKDRELAISIDVGVGDFFLEVNRALHKQLIEQKIAHDYTERPGGHTWGYCANAMPYQMLFLSRYFERAAKSAAVPAGKN